MFRKIIKWASIVLGSLVLLVLLFYAFVYFRTEQRINKQYEVSLQNITIPKDSAAYYRGERIATNRGCMGCHGNDLSGGTAFFGENNPLGILYVKNITSGRGGVQFEDADWIRVLRHGIGKDNKPVWLMPSQDIYRISNQEMGDLLCFIKAHSPVDRIVPSHSLKPLGRLLVFFDKLPFPADQIDHHAVAPDSVQATVSASYGGYLATTCMGCHGSQMKGNPAHNPGEPPIPNISSTGEVGKWTSDDFIHLFHTGLTPGGKQLNKVMPWKEFRYSDDELKAIYLYLQSIK